jgi:amino acid adenylation domain-containing protein
MEFRRLLSDSLTLSRKAHPDKIVAIAGDEQYTYEQLYWQSQVIARHLIASGVKRGDRVAIFMENTWPLLPSIYGVLYAGAVFLVINHQTKADKLEYILRDSGAVALISDSLVAKHFFAAAANAPELREILYAGTTVENPGSISLTSLTDLYQRTDVDIEPIAPKTISKDLAALIYTSGSTGDPKGVMMTHANMVFTSDSLVQYLRLDCDARIICFLPLAFDYGLYQILMTVRLGACLIVSKSFAFPAVVFNEIIQHQASVFPGVPTVYSTLIALHQKTPLCFPSVTRVTNTAAALPPEYVTALREIFPNALIYKMYGLTECKRVSYLEPELAEQYPTSVGKAIPGTEIFILDEHRQPVAPKQVGTLYVRGAHVMQGYWNKPQETQKMLVSDIFPNEQVLCAQDQFTMDDDGYLYFCGRVDDIIKARGEKVSPVEVENVLYSLQGVREAAVIGVADPVEGQYVKAFVALDKGVQLDSRKIRQHCSTRLENFMVPREIEIRDALPKTDSNKISKKDLR